MQIGEFWTNGIIAILRRIQQDRLMEVAQALIAGGVTTMECTFDQSDPQAEQKLAASLDILSRINAPICFGAGTVLTERQVELAHDHGAKLIVSPNTDVNVIHRTKALGLCSVPGAMTPSEAVCAQKAGADYVKLFPAGDLGVSYFRSISAPLSHIRFLAVGGIDSTNLTAFKAAGAYGFGISSYLTPKAAIDERHFACITQHALELTQLLEQSFQKGKP